MTGCSNKTDEDSEPVYNNHNNIIQDEQQQDKTESFETQSEPTSDADNILNNFYGIESEAQTPVYGNLSINIKPGSFSCLVCPDPERNVVYYTNFRKDNYIYELKDGVSTLLLAQETEFIQLFKGELYFLGYNGKVDGLHNNIYKYNFTTKQVETVIEAEVTWMHINEIGIYFNSLNGEKNEFYKLSFGSTEPELTQWEYFLQYKDYFIVLEKNYNDHTAKIKLIQETSGESILEIPNVRGNMSIYKDFLCYIGYAGGSEDRILNVINLKTGEQKVFEPNISSQVIKLNLLDYTIINDKIFCTVNSKFIVECNINDGSLIIKHVKTDALSEYVNIYTDGSKLFAKRQIADLKNRKTAFDIVELVVADNQVTERELGQ
jgi:hypothetical protein